MKKIFVGNLDFSATEESIRSLFAPHGTVESKAISAFATDPPSIF